MRSPWGASALAPPFVTPVIAFGLLLWLWVQARRGAEGWRLVAQGLLVALGVMELSSYYWVGLALLAPALVGRRGVGLVVALVGLETLVQAGVMSPDLQYGVMYFGLTAAALVAVSIPEPPVGVTRSQDE